MKISSSRMVYYKGSGIQAVVIVQIVRKNSFHIEILDTEQCIISLESNYQKHNKPRCRVEIPYRSTKVTMNMSKVEDKSLTVRRISADFPTKLFVYNKLSLLIEL